MKLTLRYENPVGEIYNEALLGFLPSTATYTVMFAPQSEGERSFQAACEARGIEYVIDRKTQEVSGVIIENIKYAEVGRFLMHIPVAHRKRLKSATIEK
jgi:hypothetical protein